MSTLRILHLSDTHLFGDDSRHYGVVNTAEHLERALAHVASQEFDLVVCSGDVSEDGTVASYERASRVLGGWAAERGARVLFAMGNHDSRAEFREVLGTGQPGVEVTAFTSDAGHIASSATVAGWRTIVLDTTVPQAGYGELGAAQLAWLEAELATPAEQGTVVVLHHSPLAAQTELLQALALDPADAAEFTRVISGTDVRVVLAGHYHLPIFETRGGVPILVAPGVTNVSRGFESPSEESSGNEFGGQTVTLTADGVRVLPFVRQVAPGDVFRMDADEVRRVIALAGRPTP